MNFSPISPLGYLLLVLNVRVDDARNDERGASAIEWIVIAAIVVAICIAVGATLRGALTGKATEVQGEIEGA